MDITYVNLIKWLGTFTLDKTVTSGQELTNGDLLAKVLHLISPTFFSEYWLSKIESNVKNDSSLKVKNLKRIFKAIGEFYTCDPQLAVLDIKSPNFEALAMGDEHEMKWMLQLIIVCAVNCEYKHQHIENILALEHDVQLSIMTSIKDLMQDNINNSNSNTPKNINHLLKDSNTVDQVDTIKSKNENLLKEKDSYAQRCYELDKQVVYLNEEKLMLQSEIQRLNESLVQLERSDPRTPLGRKNMYQKQIEKLQEDLNKSEIAKDDLKMTCEQLQKEVKEMKSRNDILLSSIEESQSLKDEVDVLRESSEKAIKYETTISFLRRKLEDMTDLKNQQKLLEEKNTKYIEKNLELEEELKRARTWKVQLDAYKKQLVEMQAQHAEEVDRADRLDFEAKRWQDKCTAIAKEKEVLIEEKKMLREQYDELSMQTTPDIEKSQRTGGESVMLMSHPNEAKEQLMRLQHQVRMLEQEKEASSSDASSDQSAILKSMLEDSQTRTAELEKTLRQRNQQIHAFKIQIEDFEEQKSKFDTTAISIKQAEIDKLQIELKNKDIEMKETEDKYLKYLEKAKGIINRMDPRSNDISELKSQLEEKEKYIISFEASNAVKEKEEQLILSAYYNLSTSMNKRSMEDRLLRGHQPNQQSFLSKQRHVYNTNKISFNNCSPTQNTTR